MYEGKKRYDLDEQQDKVLYLQNDNKMVSKIRSLTNAISGLITWPKSNTESMAHYQDKNKCQKTPNSLIRGDAKGDSKVMG